MFVFTPNLLKYAVTVAPAAEKTYAKFRHVKSTGILKDRYFGGRVRDRGRNIRKVFLGLFYNK